jgi:hypothetical protein
MRPRIESAGKALSDRRFTGTALGSMVASEVENDHIAQVQNDIIAGRYGKPSVSNARQFRKSTSAMFEWAAEAGRKYVKVNPCHHLPGLDSQPGRDRVLSAEEIKVLWWGPRRSRAGLHLSNRARSQVPACNHAAVKRVPAFTAA